MVSREVSAMSCGYVTPRCPTKRYENKKIQTEPPLIPPQDMTVEELFAEDQPDSVRDCSQGQCSHLLRQPVVILLYFYSAYMCPYLPIRRISGLASSPLSAQSDLSLYLLVKGPVVRCQTAFQTLFEVQFLQYFSSRDDLTMVYYNHCDSSLYSCYGYSVCSDSTFAPNTRQ